MITALVLLYPVGEEGQDALDYVDYDIMNADVTYDKLGLISGIFTMYGVCVKISMLAAISWTAGDHETTFCWEFRNLAGV